RDLPMKSAEKEMGFHIKSKRLPQNPVKEGKLFYFYVRIFLESHGNKPEAMENIDYVIYRLDPTFGDHRLQRSNNRAADFEIKIWTYGWFPVSATVMTRDGQPFEIQGKVEFEVSETEKQGQPGEFRW